MFPAGRVLGMDAKRLGIILLVPMAGVRHGGFQDVPLDRGGDPQLATGAGLVDRGTNGGRRQQQGRQAEPVPRFSLLPVNGEQHFQTVLEGRHLQARLLGRRELGVLAHLPLQLPLPLLSLPLLAALGGGQGTRVGG